MYTSLGGDSIPFKSNRRHLVSFMLERVKEMQDFWKTHYTCAQLSNIFSELLIRAFIIN